MIRLCALASAATVALLVVLFGASEASAHQVGLSRGTWVLSGDAVQAELVFARDEVRHVLPEVDADANGALDALEAQNAAGPLKRLLIEGIRVSTHDGSAEVPCPGVVEGVSLTEEDGLAARIVFACRQAHDVNIDLPMLGMLSVGHRHLAHVVAPKAARDDVLFASNARFAIGDHMERPSSAVAYFRIGVEHILLGTDHLLFLLALILVGGTVRSVLGVVTAFTLAHSVTLALAATGLLAPPASIIEPAIALSIAYVGFENFFVSDARRRWRITAPFGLIHGFGFAGALAEIGLPQGQVPLALGLFNLGVEAGQIGVLAIALPIVLLLRRSAWFRSVGVRALSAGVVAVGLFWFVQRVMSG